MSIAAISSSFVAAVRERGSSSVEAVAATRPTARAAQDGGRRHELVGAMKQVLGMEDGVDRTEDQAVFRFAHALMHDLRSIDGGAAREGPGRGNAWGRRNWSDLPQRIDALATAASAPPAAPPGVVAAPAPTPAPVQAVPDPEIDTAPTTPVATALPRADASALPEELPPPNPVTSTSAAVHLMQVPSSRLIEAYAALRQALGAQSDAPAGSSLRGELSAFLDRLAEKLAPDTAAELPSGSVLHLTA
jgi:hypothetical protein